jgi:hypothetical protein
MTESQLRGLSNCAYLKAMDNIRFRFIFLFIFLLFLSSCASFSARPTSFSFETPEECKEFLNRLDEIVKEVGVRDGSSVSVPGLPYLRGNRFLESLKKKVKSDEEKREWVRWMQELDLESRKKEISNLPDQAILSIEMKDVKKIDRENLYAQMKSCSSKLLSYDQVGPDFYDTLFSLFHIPDEYSFFRRAMGLYPLISIPVVVVTERSRNKMRSRFTTPLNELPVDGNLKAYLPAKEISLAENEVREIMERSKMNPLRVPRLDKHEEEKLVWSFAPTLIQDVAASYDQIGEIIWKKGQGEVNPEKPAVYYYLSHAFLEGKPILQINYVLWYSKRAGESPPWIEKGHLDGLTIRISLDDQGKVFMVDVENNCGCYHFFVPEEERVEKVLSRSLKFDPLVAQWLPVIPSGEHLGIRINSGWHQVQRLIPVRHFADSIPYTLIPYDVLETLPHEEGRTESIFNSKGIAKGSERVERFILFPMGIPSIGSMRQRGHHAIELIGRVHFDDPNLFDQNFIFK